MSTVEYAIELNEVTKHFHRRTVKGGYTTFKTQLVGILSGDRKERFESKNVRVLKGITLKVPRGKTIGIIGENGSGKSTLLKILTGIYSPTSGSVQVRGRVSALLELGAGFHPEFSGRENIFINGVILGLSRSEIRGRINEIIAFSELADFIDEPVRTYSSGMYMRLAFAVATFVDPEILIIDEILSVGDEHFGRKSRAKMEEFKDGGKTIVLVTHDLGSVEKWCDLAAWLDEGRIAEVGDPRRVVAAYRQRVAEKEMTATPIGQLESGSTEHVPVAVTSQPAAAAPIAETSIEPAGGPAPPQPNRWGNQTVLISTVRLLNVAGQGQLVYAPDEAMVIELGFESASTVNDVGFGIGIFRTDGVHAYGTNTFIDELELPTPLPPKGVVRFVCDRLGLNDGNYSLDVATHSKHGVAYDYQKGLHQFAVRSDVGDVGIVRPPHRWQFKAESPAMEQRPAGVVASLPPK